MLDCDNPFWKFSLAVYASPGVAAECLALQSAWTIDVNFLLFCAWLGAAKKIVLDKTDLTAIEASVRQWHATVISPLRAVRQHIKTMPEMSHNVVQGLHKDITAAELRAEQIEQAFMFESAHSLVAGTAAADVAVRANVTALLQHTTRSVSPEPIPSPLLIAAAIAYRS